MSDMFAKILRKCENFAVFKTPKRVLKRTFSRKQEGDEILSLKSDFIS